MVRGVIYCLAVLLLLSLALNLQMLELTNMLMTQADARDARVQELEQRSQDLTGVVNTIGGFVGGYVEGGQ